MIRPNASPAGDDRPVVVVTSSSGLTGQAVVRRLAARCRVLGLGRVEPTTLIEGVEHLPCDITAERSLAEAMALVHRLAGDRLASVVHLAEDHAGDEAARRVFEHARPLAPRQFIYTSTMLVHASCEPGQRIDEHWPIEPRDARGRSAAAAERWLGEHGGATPTVTLRLADLYDDVCHAPSLARQVQRIYERQMLAEVYPGNVAHGRAMLHRDDLAEALECVIGRRDALPEYGVLLVGEPETLSYGRIQQRVAWQLYGQAWTTQSIPKSRAKAGAWVRGRVPVGEEPFVVGEAIDHVDDHYSLDISRAQAWLDWQPRRRLSEALRTIVQMLQADPVAWYREHGLPMPGWLEESARTRSTALFPPPTGE
ncbi:NAD-dependent epimerase/dehydratase family protein [Phycisphaerales bacterium AB-hyl4]|uniref:NAD-dependent epimerase/dehydratase family protein n=1 Tax=Natronomicrosphaera hydrolytica TaxID=3242702 RepID=A0ABV4UBA7_9BACT